MSKPLSRKTPQAGLLYLKDSKGGGDGFEVQKYGDGRVALIGMHHPLAKITELITMQTALTNDSHWQSNHIAPVMLASIQPCILHDGQRGSQQNRSKVLQVNS